MFSESQNDLTCQIITFFPLIYLTHSDGTLLNENHDDLIKAALSCLKDYAINLQRRIKILRDPASFCPKYNLNSSIRKIYN